MNQFAIDRFTQHFTQQIEEITKVENAVYRKLLFVCVLDTLAICRYPKRDNKGRLIGLINNYSGWSDSLRVSLIHLDLHLDCVLGEGEKKSSILYDQVHRQISALDKEKIYRSEIDLDYNQTVKLAKKQEFGCIKLARNSELLYAYRNSLVHAFKEPGHQIEISDYGSEPYYDTQSTDQWELIYPVEFFRNLCSRSLSNIKDYLIDEGVNPYSRYREINAIGDYWINPNKLRSEKSDGFFQKFVKLISSRQSQSILV